MNPSRIKVAFELVIIVVTSISYPHFQHATCYSTSQSSTQKTRYMYASVARFTTKHSAGELDFSYQHLNRGSSEPMIRLQADSLSPLFVVRLVELNKPLGSSLRLVESPGFDLSLEQLIKLGSRASKMHKLTSMTKVLDNVSSSWSHPRVSGIRNHMPATNGRPIPA